MSDVYADYDGPLTDRELLEVALAARKNRVERKERFRTLFENQGYGSGAEADRVFDLFDRHDVIEVSGSPTGSENNVETETETPAPDAGRGGGLDIDGGDGEALIDALEGPEFRDLGIDWRPATADDLAPWGQEGGVPLAFAPAEHGHTAATIAMPVADFKQLQEYIGIDLNPHGPDQGAPADPAEFWRHADDDTVESIADSLRAGEGEVPTPWVEFGRDGSLRNTQEGRNRALAAEAAGLDRIPVRVVYNGQHDGRKGPLFDHSSPTSPSSPPDPGSMPSDAESGPSGGGGSRDLPDSESGSILAEIEREIDEAAGTASSGGGGSTASGGDSDSDVPLIAERNPLKHPGVYIISGARGKGKTMLAYRAAEIIAEDNYVLPVTVGLPESIHNEFPPDWYHVQSISEAPHEAVLVVDEAYDQFHAREAWDEENISMAGLVNQSRHTGRTIFFISQSTSHLDKTAITEADGLLMKEPGAFHQNFERQQLRSLLKEAEAAFAELPEGAQPQEYCYVISNDYTGMIRNRLPEFHSTRLSRAYGRQDGG